MKAYLAVRRQVTVGSGQLVEVRAWYFVCLLSHYIHVTQDQSPRAVVSNQTTPPHQFLSYFNILTTEIINIEKYTKSRDIFVVCQFETELLTCGSFRQRILQPHQLGQVRDSQNYSISISNARIARQNKTIEQNCNIIFFCLLLI